MAFRLDDAPFTRSASGSKRSARAGGSKQTSIKYISSPSQQTSSRMPVQQEEMEQEDELSPMPYPRYPHHYAAAVESPTSLASSVSPTHPSPHSQSRPSSASTTATFEIGDPFPRPHRRSSRPSSAASSSYIPHVPSAYSQPTYDPSSSSSQQRYGFPYRSSILTTSTSDEQLRRSLELNDQQQQQLARDSYRGREEMRPVRFERMSNGDELDLQDDYDRRFSSEVDLNLSIDEEHYLDEPIQEMESSRPHYDGMLVPRESEYDLAKEGAIGRTASGGGLRQAYQEGERTLRNFSSNDTTLRLDSIQHHRAFRYQAAAVATDNILVYNSSDAFTASGSGSLANDYRHRSNGGVDPAWRERTSALGYYDDDARAFEGISLAEQQTRAAKDEAQEEASRLVREKKQKRTSWVESTTSSTSLNHHSQHHARLRSPLLSPLSDDYSSTSGFTTSPSLIHDTPSMSTMEDELSELTASPRLRMQLIRSRSQEALRSSKDTAVVTMPSPTYDVDYRHRRAEAGLDGLGLTLGNNDRVYDGSQGSRPYHRPFRLSYSSAPIALPPAVSVRSPTPPARHERRDSRASSFASTSASSFSEHLPSPSRRLSHLSMHSNHAVIDITVSSSTPSPPRRFIPSAHRQPAESTYPLPTSYDLTHDARRSRDYSLPSTLRQQQVYADPKPSLFRFVPAPLELVSRYINRRSTTVLSVPPPSFNLPSGQASSPPPSSRPILHQPHTQILIEPQQRQHPSRTQRPFTYSDLFFWNGSIDDVVPAKLCFILGFVVGPWAWLLGGFLMNPRNGELLRTIGRRCRKKRRATARGITAGDVGRGGGVAGTAMEEGCGCGKMLKESPSAPRVATAKASSKSEASFAAAVGSGRASNEKVDSVPVEGVDDEIETWKGVEKWVMINRIAAGASSALSFPIVGYALWAAVTG